MVHNNTNPQSPSYITCNLLSGGIANAVSRTAVAPFERMRLSMQVDSTKYKNSIHCFQDILKHEGIIGFYRGNWLNILRIFPQGGVSFVVKDYIKSVLTGNQTTATTWQLGVASTVSGAVCMTAVYPLDMIRGQITVLPKHTFPSIYSALQYNYNNTTPHIYGLYKGCSYSVLWSSVYYGVQFLVYDTLKSYYIQYQQLYSNNNKNSNTDTISGTAGFAFGSIAGAICTTVAFPLESIRRKLQLQGLGNRAILYTGFRHCFRTVYKSEGLNGLFNGLVPNLMKSPLAVALIFSIHETLMAQAKQSNLY